jgi:uridine kinase
MGDQQSYVIGIAGESGFGNTTVIKRNIEKAASMIEGRP